MAHYCPLCSAAVSEEHTRCPACGSELDPFGTIQLPGKKGRPVARPPSSPGVSTGLEAEESPLPRAPAPPAAPKKLKPKPKPQAAPVAANPEPARPPQLQPQPIQPQPPPQQLGPYAPASPSPMAYGPPQPGQAGPGGLRGWMIKMLGGQGDAAAQAAQSGPQGSPAGAPYPVMPQPPYPGGAPWAGVGGGSGVIPPMGYPGGLPAPPQSPAPPMPPQPGMHAPAYVRQEPEPEGATQYMPGADIGRLKFPSTIYTLQLLDNSGQWRSWAPIGANGLNLGRSQNSAHFPFLSSMANRHLKFSYDGPRLFVEDLKSLNGVYVKITTAIALQDNQRFRVGSQVIEFHRAEPFQAVLPLQSNDGEEFLSYDLEPLAYLDLIRPNEQPGLRFPITKPEVTRIGRDAKLVEIALPRAEWVSGQHAQIRHEKGIFYLDDLNSRNGTFVQIPEKTELNSGDVLLVGRAFLRVVDQAAG
jgi:pSer/pThr/pTyr-binding forkhead associated (FHA) protein